MITSKTPLRVLQAEADRIAKTIKAAERGEKVGHYVAEKMARARNNPAVRVAIVMDHKIIPLRIPWTTLHNTSEAALSEYILQQMKSSRET